MPPENTSPVAKSGTSEFEFEALQPENPRMKKRNLKVKSAVENVAPAASASGPAPASGQPRPAVYAQPAAAAQPTSESRPTYMRPSGTAERPQPAPATGVLYYSSQNGPRKEDSMKSTTPQQAARPATASTQPVPQRPAAAASHTASPRPASAASQPFSQRSSSTASTPQASPSRPAGATPTNVSSHSNAAASSFAPGVSHAAPASRPASSTAASGATAGATRAVSTTVAGPSSTSRPANVSDYRSNIERQSREQKSVGGILNIIVYALIALFVCGGLFAAYGAHDVYKQLSAQSTTVSELDSRYSAANQQLTDQLKTTQQSVDALQGQLSHAQELLVRQNDVLTKIQASLDAQSEALRQERATRAAETSIRAQENSVLRARLHALENKNETNYRP
jgi:cell division protein FtsB